MNSDHKISTFAKFLANCSKALIESGCSSNRLENLLESLGKNWGFNVEAFATPTGMFLMISRDQEVHNSMTRIKAWSVNIDRIQKINDLVIQLSSKSIDIEEAQNKLTEIINSPLPYNKITTLLAGGGAAGGLVFLLGGNWIDVITATCLGVILFILQSYFSTGPNRRYLTDFIASFTIALLATGLKKFFPTLNDGLVITGGIVLLIPGLVFLNAIHEIALKNLISGTSKLVEAFIVALSLSFGIASAVAVVSLFGN